MSHLVCFMAGVVAALNIATMFPNAGYEAAWWKFFGAVTVALLVALLERTWMGGRK